MKIDKIVLSFYLNNQDVVRVKISPLLAGMSMLTLFALPFLFLGMVPVNKNSPIVISESQIVPLMNKEIKKTQQIIFKSSSVKKLVNKGLQKFKLSNTKGYMMKNFTAEDDSVIFFLSKIDRSNRDQYRGHIVGTLLRKDNLKAEIKSAKQSFSFKGGRYTKMKFTKVAMEKANKLRIDVQEKGIVIFSETIDLETL